RAGARQSEPRLWPRGGALCAEQRIFARSRSQRHRRRDHNPDCRQLRAALEVREPKRPVVAGVRVDRTEQLRRVELFSSLKDRALERVASIAHEESYATGANIFQHGDVGDKVYLILEGKVRIARQVPGIGEEALAVLGPGQVFGEMALLVESPRSADALSHDGCRLLAIAKEDLDDLLFQDKDLAYEVLWSTVHMLVGRLRSTNDKLTMLGISGRFS